MRKGLKQNKMNIIVYVVVLVLITTEAMLSKDLVDYKPQERDDLFEGDIKLTAKQRTIIDEAAADGPMGVVGKVGQRKATSDLVLRWPKQGQYAVVPYVITTPAVAAVVEPAIAHWHQRTCIKFVPRTDETDYVEFTEEEGCWSALGRAGGKQLLSIGKDCSIGNAMHEIGHTIGFWHEHSRPDRDDYITVNYNNVKPNETIQFEKFALSDIVTHNIPYDVGSVMHYPKDAFSANEKDTITVKNKGEAWKMGQRNCLSGADSKLANIIYQCNDETSCTDSISDCPARADSGECETNAVYMSTNCKLSCVMCDGCCVDDILHCEDYVPYCSSDEEVRKDCKKTCEVCT